MAGGGRRRYSCPLKQPGLRPSRCDYLSSSAHTPLIRRFNPYTDNRHSR